MFAPDNEENKGDKEENKQGSGDQDPKIKEALDQAEKTKGENDKLKQDLEDLRMEVMTPEYLEFLNGKGKNGDKGGKGNKEENNKGEKDPYAGLTASQIASKVKEELQAELDQRLDSRTKEETANAVAEFFEGNEEAVPYRPIMYGLSLLPENKKKSLDQLLTAAKEHVKKIHTPATDKEKEKSRKAGGEKPGSDTRSFEKKDKKLTPEEAAEEAWDETVGPSGLKLS